MNSKNETLAKQNIFRVIQHATYRTMPWKNGQGITEEIIKYPDECESQNSDFLWRLSLAKIQNASAFSTYPYHNRLIAILSGRLQIQREQNKIILNPGEILSFSGTEKIFAAPLESNVCDLGFIFSKNIVQAKMDKIFFQSKPRAFTFNSHHLFFFSLNNCKITIYPKEESFFLHERDTFIIEKNEKKEVIFHIDPLEKNFLAFAIESTSFFV